MGEYTISSSEMDEEARVSHVRVTREDWLTASRDVLVSEGVAEVKVLSLSQRLQVSRSSFYWYFKNREHLLQELLDDWEKRNTRTIIGYCALPARDISWATCNFFRCFIDPALFDRGLDFAVREWARRDDAVRLRIDAADRARLGAVSTMFERYGYSAEDADVRARILYFMQLGYHALDVRESMDDRMARLAGYLRGFTGAEPDPASIVDFLAFVRKTGSTR